MLTAVLDTQIILRDAPSATSSITAKIYAAWNADDDKFLECEYVGGADYIVSADTDLLVRREVQAIPVADATTFWEP